MRYIYLFILLWAGLATAQTTQPNVLLILADDLGINALNCYGNKVVETPHIDRLFEQGMHFTNGYANDPTCAPSRASIMTGQLSPRTNIYRVIDRHYTAKNAEEMRQHMRYLPPATANLYSGNNGLNPEQLNIAKVFKGAGYRTAAFGKWHLGTGTSAMHKVGFDVAIEAKKHYNFSTVPQQDDYDSKVYNADYCTQKGVDFMNACVENDQPFFLFMPYYLVHAPFDPKPEYVKYFSNKLKGSEYDHEQVIDVIAMIKSLDDSVGELLDNLERMGIADNTIVIFTSDNGHYQVKGNNLFAQPYRGNKGVMWEGGVRIPYIFKWPDHIEPGTISELPIIHVDLFPTLADMANIQIDENHIIDGISIKGTLIISLME
jgi:arylsulfatase A-like enzyme